MSRPVRCWPVRDRRGVIVGMDDARLLDEPLAGCGDGRESRRCRLAWSSWCGPGSGSCATSWRCRRSENRQERGRPLPFTARWSGSGPARCALIECVVEWRSFWPVPGGGFDRAAPSGRRHDAMGTASPTARTRPQLSFLRTSANRSEYPTTQVTARDRAHPGKRSTRRRCRQADSIHVEYTTADPHDRQL